MADPTASTNHPEVSEISLKQIASFFKKYLLLFFLTSLVFGGIGYYYATTLPEQYSSVARILPEYSGAAPSSGGLGDLASLAGVSLRGRTDAIRPDLYPDILNSRPFLIKALSTKLPTRNGNQVLLINVLSKKATPFTAAQIASYDTLVNMTKEQEGAMNALRFRITPVIEKTSGVLAISVELPDPILAAATARMAVEYLQEFVTNYRSAKLVERIHLLTKQGEEARQKYQKAEIALSSYRDRNLNPFTNLSRVEEQRLQNDFLQYQALYTELRRQLEAVKLQVQEEAPVVKVLEPPMVANRKSKPKKLIIGLQFAVVGAMLAFLFAFFLKEKLHRKLFS
jgi:uncharacterized protein involved in exopolysaccharide biosynthesis